jgi:hypothetical protein
LRFFAGATWQPQVDPLEFISLSLLYLYLPEEQPQALRTSLPLDTVRQILPTGILLYLQEDTFSPLPLIVHVQTKREKRIKDVGFGHRHFSYVSQVLGVSLGNLAGLFFDKLSDFLLVA